MRIKAWVEVYPWHLKPGSTPYIHTEPPTYEVDKANGGKRYVLEFDVPDPVKVDGIIFNVEVKKDAV